MDTEDAVAFVVVVSVVLLLVLTSMEVRKVVFGQKGCICLSYMSKYTMDIEQGSGSLRLCCQSVGGPLDAEMLLMAADGKNGEDGKITKPLLMVRVRGI